MANEILKKFAFWDEVLNEVETDFESNDYHVAKCGYCGGTPK